MALEIMLEVLDADVSDAEKFLDLGDLEGVVFTQLKLQYIRRSRLLPLMFIKLFSEELGNAIGVVDQIGKVEKRYILLRNLHNPANIFKLLDFLVFKKIELSEL